MCMLTSRARSSRQPLLSGDLFESRSPRCVQKRWPSSAKADVPVQSATSRERGVVAVVPGQALADLFESVGATALIGAPGHRPHLAAFLSAIERCQGPGRGVAAQRQ